MGVRQYDPSLGQFTSEDPVLGITGIGQSHNRYAYALDNPLRFYDLDGRSVFGDILGEAGDFYSDAFNDIGNSDFYRYGVVPAVNTGYNFLPHRWGDLHDDWQAGLQQLPRGLRAFDKALVEWGPMFLPLGGVVRVGKLGGKISRFSGHGVNQTITRGVRPNYILDTVRNPLQITRKVDKLGRVSIEHVGKKATVVLSPEGRIITTHPTSTRLARKLRQ